MGKRCASVALTVFLLACGGDDDASIDPGMPVAGTSVVFDLDADVTDPAFFFDLPYPSDLLLDSSGRPDLSGFLAVEDNVILAPLQRIVSDRPGFPVMPAAYFRFDAPLASRNIEDAVPPSPDAPVLLVDIDPVSPERGRLFPVIASALEPDPFAPPYLLALGGVPGMILSPERTYAFVVRRAFGDASGVPLGVPEAFARLRAGRVPEGRRGAAAAELFAPLWETLDEIGVARSTVAAATVFTTGDVVAEMSRIGDVIVDTQSVEIENLTVDAVDGEAHERFCEIVGTVRMPQFQTGEPPFNVGGVFELDANGIPVQQGEIEIPVTLTVPRRPMPLEGYPLVIYFHGSGGASSQVVDRGPVVEAGGLPLVGRGPAHVVAEHGFAAFGSALPANPERVPGAASLAYINFNNLASYRDTFRQGTIEQRLLIDALSRLSIPPELLSGCDGASLPDGAEAYTLNVDPLFVMGQSMGAQYANMVGATEPRSALVVPTGSGGFWSLLVLVTELVPGVDTADAIAALIGTTATINHLHPAMVLLQTAWEAADPIAYAARLARRPLPGHAARSIFQPVGRADPDFPEVIFDAMALAHGNRQAGEVLWDSMQEALSHDGLDGFDDYPVEDNLVSESGEPYTGVVVQYEGDGLLSSHHIFAQLDEVKYQYGCFFLRFLENGRAIVSAPAPLGSACGDAR